MTCQAISPPGHPGPSYSCELEGPHPKTGHSALGGLVTWGRPARVSAGASS